MIVTSNLQALRTIGYYKVIGYCSLNKSIQRKNEQDRRRQPVFSMSTTELL